MTSTTRQRLLWLCVAASLLLAVAEGAVWELQHDEGTTFDLAVGLIDESHFVPTSKEPPAPVTALYRTIDGTTDYSALDAVRSVSVPGFRLFHPPAYYLLLHLWTKVFGTSRLILRLPAYLLLALAILGMARLAAAVIPEPGAGLWAALLFGLSPWVLRITNFVRPYHLALFCAVWATVAAVELLGQRPRQRWRVLFVALSLLGIYTLYHYGIVLVWHLALLAWHARTVAPERRPGETRRLGVVVICLVAGFAPWMRNFFLHMQLAGSSSDYFTGSVEPTHWLQYALRAFQDFAIADSWSTLGGRVLTPMAAVLGALSVPVVLRAFAGPARKTLQGASRRFWISCAMMPLLLLATDLWRGTHTLFITKLCFGMIIVLMLLVIRGWLALPRGWLRNAGLGCWALLFLAAVSLNTYAHARRTTGMAAAAANIAQADSGYHLVVINTDLRGYIVPFLISLQEAGVHDVFVIQSRGGQQLLQLMTKVQQGWSSHFQRISLVNFQVPWSPHGLTWQTSFLKGTIARWAWTSGDWRVFWQSKQSWMGAAQAVTRDRAPDVAHELWMIGPIHTSFFTRPIQTETADEQQDSNG